MPEFRPALRRDVRIEAAAEGIVLHDAPLDRQVVLKEMPSALVPLLDGTRTLAQLRAQVGGPPEEVDRALRGFLLLNLTEGAGSEIVARARRVHSGELKLPHSILDGARFACQGSGECCQNYNLGPLDEADVARLATFDVAGAFPHLGAGPYHEEYPCDEGGVERYLKKVDERCVFLLADLRCGLHARFGAEAKPTLCRTYPLQQMATLDGIKLFDGGSCASFTTSCRTGTPLVEEVRRWETLLPRRHPLFHPAVFLDDAIGCDYGHFLALTRANLQLVNAGLGSAAETLRAVARQTRHFAARLCQCPLAPGEPDATVAQALSATPASWYAAAMPEPAGGAARTCALAGALVAAVMDGATRLHGETALLLGLLQRVTAHAADPGAGRLLPDDKRVMRVRVEDPEVDAVLRISLRQQLFGRGGLVQLQLTPGLLRLAMIQLCAELGARLRAAIARAPSLRVADLSWGHMLAVRILSLESTSKVFVAHRADTEAVLEALPVLLRG